MPSSNKVNEKPAPEARMNYRADKQPPKFLSRFSTNTLFYRKAVRDGQAKIGHVDPSASGPIKAVEKS